MTKFGDEPQFVLRQRELDRLLYKTRQEALEEAARVAAWPCGPTLPPEVYATSYAKGRNDAAAAIRALKV